MVDDRLRFVHASFKHGRNDDLRDLVLASERLYEVHQVSDGFLHVLDEHALHFSAGIVVLDVVDLGNQCARRQPQ